MAFFTSVVTVGALLPSRLATDSITTSVGATSLLAYQV